MEIWLPDTPVKIIVLKDVFNDEELWKVKNEIEFLWPKLGPAETTSAAVDERGARKKVGRGVFLDNVYADRGYSDILCATRKFFTDQEIKKTIEEFAKEDIYWRQWPHMNYDTTLLQEYRNGDYYDWHVDYSSFTIVTNLKFDGLKCNGGDLNIDMGDSGFTLTEHNRAVIFPSVLKHRVSEMYLDSGYQFRSDILPERVNPFMRRWSIAQLVTRKEI